MQNKLENDFGSNPYWFCTVLRPVVFVANPHSKFFWKFLLPYSPSWTIQSKNDERGAQRPLWSKVRQIGNGFGGILSTLLELRARWSPEIGAQNSESATLPLRKVTSKLLLEAPRFIGLNFNMIRTSETSSEQKICSHLGGSRVRNLLAKKL